MRSFVGLCVTSTLFLVACTDADPDMGPELGGAELTANTRYQQLVDGAPDLETCQRETANTGFNCLRWMTVCENGGFTLVVTDIINEGRYTANGNVLAAELMGPGDAPDRFTMTLREGGFESAELTGEHPWVVASATAAELDSECATLEGRTWW